MVRAAARKNKRHSSSQPRVERNENSSDLHRPRTRNLPEAFARQREERREHEHHDESRSCGRGTGGPEWVRSRSAKHAERRGREQSEYPTVESRSVSPAWGYELDGPRKVDRCRLGLFAETACFHCQMLFECFTALPIDSRCFLLPRHLASGREQIQRSVDLVNQRVPSASFHLIIFKCRQHSIGPDNRLSPPANVGCLPGWCSRKRHSVRQSVFRLTFHESELYESTFLPATGGFQPPKGAFARGGFGSRRSTLL